MHLEKDAGKFWSFATDTAISLRIDGLWENFNFAKGTKTDLGSVPLKMQGIVNNGSNDDLALAIFLCHDCGYSCHERSRSWYDDMLHEGLDLKKIKVMDAWDGALAWIAVHFCGGKAWKQRKAGDGYSHVTMEPSPKYGLATQYKANHV